LHSVFRFNISILEYFQFGFAEKTNLERKEWAGTGYMYDYQLKMNPCLIYLKKLMLKSIIII
jgi:hypothetical protein